SAFVHAHAALGERDFHAADGLRAAFLDPAAETVTMTAAERGRLLAARGHLETAERWGLAPSPWQALRLAWLAAFFDDRGDLERSAGLALAGGEAPAEIHQLVARDAWRRGTRPPPRRPTSGPSPPIPARPARTWAWASSPRRPETSPPPAPLSTAAWRA